MPPLTITPTSIVLETTTLELKPQWLEVLQLAALHHLENNPDLSAADILALPHWHGKAQNSIGVMLSREHQKWQSALGVALLEGSFYKVFRLNPDLQPVFVQPLEQVRQALAPKPTIIRLENPNADAQALLSLGKIRIERGRLKEATEIFAEALEIETSPITKQEVLFYQARAFEFLSQWEAANKALRRLEKCLEWHKNNGNGNSTEGVAWAWLYIGRARIHLRHSQWEDALTLYKKAKRLLEPHQHREWGMVHNGFGRYYQNSTVAEDLPQTRIEKIREINLSKALEHYEAAFIHYNTANWRWAAQASLNDCGVAYKERCKLIWQQQNSQARKHLAQALRCFYLCQKICEEDQMGDESAVVEINLGWAYRMSGETQTARDWLEKAVSLAQKAGNLSDLGWAFCEYAELEVQLGDRAAARLRLEQAVDVFDAVGMRDARAWAKKRLQEV